MVNALLVGSSRSYFLRRRLPPCQSSSMPVSPGLTPKLRSWGRSRRLRLSSAKPGKEASPTTWSHSRTASASLGSRLMTGPKKAVPPRRAEVDDRGADVLARQGERLVGFRAQFAVPAGVLQGGGEPGGQSGPLERRLDGRNASPPLRAPPGGASGA